MEDSATVACLKYSFVQKEIKCLIVLLKEDKLLGHFVSEFDSGHRKE